NAQTGTRTSVATRGAQTSVEFVRLALASNDPGYTTTHTTLLRCQLTSSLLGVAILANRFAMVLAPDIPQQRLVVARPSGELPKTVVHVSPTIELMPCWRRHKAVRHGRAIARSSGLVPITGTQDSSVG